MGEGYLSSLEPLNNSLANIFHQYFTNSLNMKIKGLKGKIDMVIRGGHLSTFWQVLTLCGCNYTFPFIGSRLDEAGQLFLFY